MRAALAAVAAFLLSAGPVIAGAKALELELAALDFAKEVKKPSCCAG
ncbi:MAG: hypothetical protein M3P48_03760 [Actinomycetota bacterium]|nr:hypothetical protein [Actinomycetota bacterium]